MADFNSRRETFERKFAHDEALRFKAIARRNKLFGVWAARQLGKSEADVEAYANTVVVADFDEPGDDDVIRKVAVDLDKAGVAVHEGELRRVLEGFIDRAIHEVKGGP